MGEDRLNVTRTLRRLTRTTNEEMRTRCLEQARVAREAAEYAAGYKWRRERLRSRLVARSVVLERGVQAISRKDWAGADAALRRHFIERAPRFILNPADRVRVSAAGRDYFPESIDSAAERAAPLVDHRYDLLGYRNLSFQRDGSPVDWHFDPVHGRRAPIMFWARVPYLNPRYGDHKIIWELNRHQHWLALGRAAWLTGDDRYVSAWAAELESWMPANPPLTGINWSSMLELAFRSISWIWALHFFVSFDRAVPPGAIVDLVLGLDRQLEQITRHLSYYFSPNTHLLGEALALYVAGRTLPELRSAGRWENLGRGILLREARAQVHPEGSHAEQSPHYHRYALDFYLLALAVARKTDDEAARDFADIASRMASFCRAIADDNGQLPTIGDDDGGLLFPICGRSPEDARDSLALAAALLARPELAVDGPPEEVFWMLGGDPAACVSSSTQHRRRVPASHFFSDSGYVVLNSHTSHAIFDAGPHGFLNGGHAHSDALSMTLTVRNRPVLIDPGTATYSNAVLRDRFRSTAMHNTVVLNGRSQALPAGPFQWHSRANGCVDLWRRGFEIPRVSAPEPAPRGVVSADINEAPFDYVEAMHDGYLPNVHRRGMLRMSADDDLWIIIDHILGTGQHEAQAYWHFDRSWKHDTKSTHGTAQLAHPDGLVASVASTGQTRVDFFGDPDGIGWCAPRYGHIVPAPAIRYAQCGSGSMTMFTAIAVSERSVRLSIEQTPVLTDAGAGWHIAAAIVGLDAERVVVLVATPDTTPAAKGTPRALQRVGLGDAEFSTDARVSALRLTSSAEPLSLSFIDGTVAALTGRHAFSVPVQPAAQDLHFDTTAIQRFSWAPRSVAGVCSSSE